MSELNPYDNIAPIRDFSIGETRARVYETVENDGFAIYVVRRETGFSRSFEDYKLCLQAAVNEALVTEAPVGHLPLPKWKKVLTRLRIERDDALKAVDTIIDKLYANVAKGYANITEFPEHPYLCRRYLPFLDDSSARSVLQTAVEEALGPLACTLETWVSHQLPQQAQLLQQAQYFSLPESYHMRIVWMKQLKAHISVL